MVDVGGTLWPNSWPFRETDAVGRRQRIAAAMPALEPAAIQALADDLISSSRPGDEARSISTEMEIVVKAEVLIANSLARQGLPADPQTVTRLRRAMSIPISDRMRPLPGARELLAEMHALGMRTVIASNTYWRDADSYWDDFQLLGLAEHIDAIFTRRRTTSFRRLRSGCARSSFTPMTPSRPRAEPTRLHPTSGRARRS